MVVSNMSDAAGLGVDSDPVTLNPDWSRLARLILLASLAAIGSVGNVFMISAVMIEDYLRKRGRLLLLRYYVLSSAPILVTSIKHFPFLI